MTVASAMLLVLGFILAFNPIVVLIGPFGLRVSDVIVPLIALFLAASGAARGAAARLPYAVVFLALAVGAFYFALEVFNGQTAAFLARLVLYGGAVALAGDAIVREGKVAHPFASGVLIGLCVNAVLLVIERKAPGSLLALHLTIDPQALKSWANGNLRASGVWGHPNEAMAVVVIFASVVLGGGALDRRRWALTALVGLILVVSAYATLTRSGVLVICAVLMAQAFRRGPVAILLLLIAAIVAAPVVFEYAPSVIDKIERRISVGLDENVSGRISTTMVAAEYALNHPWGSTIADLNDYMETDGEVAATHNSIIFMAAILGLPAGLLAFGRLVHQAVMRGGGDVSVIALVMLLQFMFEEAIIGPSVIFLFFLVINAELPRRPARRRGRVGRAPAPRPPALAPLPVLRTRRSS